MRKTLWFLRISKTVIIRFACSVTIFGGSAGGASVTYLMASPLAKGKTMTLRKTLTCYQCWREKCFSGYFSKAIAHSGTNLAPWSQPANKGFARQQALKLANMLHCLRTTWFETLNCLRKIPYYLFPAALYRFFVNIWKNGLFTQAGYQF